MTFVNNSGIWGRSSEIGHKGLLLIPFTIHSDYWALHDSLIERGEMAITVLFRDRDDYESELCLMTVRPDDDKDIPSDIAAALYDCGGYYSITKFNRDGYRHLWLHNPGQPDKHLLSLVECSEELAWKHRYSLYVLKTQQNWAVLGS